MLKKQQAKRGIFITLLHYRKTGKNFCGRTGVTVYDQFLPIFISLHFMKNAHKERRSYKINKIQMTQEKKQLTRQKKMYPQQNW